MRGRLAVFFISAVVVAVTFSACGDDDRPSGGDAVQFDDATVQKDIAYCTPEGNAQKLDIVQPPAAPSAPRPLAVYFHGGSWTTGSKQGFNRWFTDVAENLLGRGFVVATVDYRLAKDDPWTAQVEDARCAIRFLRTHAADWSIDAARIAVWGDSTGAWLADMIALPGEDAGFDNGEWPGVSSSVRAVVDLWGPSDLDAADLSAERVKMVKRIFGKEASEIGRASPLDYVTASSPPHLIIHGDRDDTVPLSQSQALDTALKAAGVSSELIVVERGTHGLLTGDYTPASPELIGRIAAFMDLMLK